MQQPPKRGKAKYPRYAEVDDAWVNFLQHFNERVQDLRADRCRRGKPQLRIIAKDGARSLIA